MEIIREPSHYLHETSWIKADQSHSIRTASSGKDCHEPNVIPGRHQASTGKTKTNTFRIGAWNVRRLEEIWKLDNKVNEMKQDENWYSKNGDEVQGIWRIQQYNI